jgi:hypothetical protein
VTVEWLTLRIVAWTFAGAAGGLAGLGLIALALAPVRRRCREHAELAQAISRIGRTHVPAPSRNVSDISLAEHRARAHRSCVRHGLIDPDPEDQR